MKALFVCPLAQLFAFLSISRSFFSFSAAIRVQWIHLERGHRSVPMLLAMAILIEHFRNFPNTRGANCSGRGERDGVVCGLNSVQYHRKIESETVNDQKAAPPSLPGPATIINGDCTRRDLPFGGWKSSPYSDMYGEHITHLNQIELKSITLHYVYMFNWFLDLNWCENNVHTYVCYASTQCTVS